MSAPPGTASLAQKLWRGAGVVIGVKLLGAGLTYVMFVMLARAMTDTGYGVFSTGFSLATILAQLALLGQAQLVLRELPRFEVSHDSRPARAFLRLGYLRVMAGLLLVALGLATAAFAGLNAPLSAVFVLVLSLALADFQQQALRGRGHIFRAFLPRDILWRLGVIAVCGAALAGWGAPLSGQGGIWAAALILLVLVLAQSFADRPTMIWRRGTAPLPARRHMRASAHYWFSSVISIGVPNLSTITVGVFLSIEDAALFFAATKTAQAMQFLPTAMILVGAPQVSRAFHNADMGSVQQICRLIAGFVLVVVAGLSVVLLGFGQDILSAFGAGFERAYPVLLILVAGYSVSALCGPTNALMSLSDNQAVLNRAMLIANAGAIALFPLAAWGFGMVGVAACFAGAVAGWNLWVRNWIRKEMAVESSVLTLLPGYPAR